MSAPKTLFFGTSAFAVPSLDVVADRSDLAGVVTQPDRPAGRGQRLQQSPVKRAALERGLRVYEPRRLRDFANEIASLAFDVFIVASYGKILPSELLALPALGALNVHPSLLPRYRGATPIQATLLAGDRETGVTIMLMDAGMDTGDIVLQERLEIGAEEDFATLHDRLAKLGARLLGDALALGERDGAFPRLPQRGEGSVTRPIAKPDLEIDWRWDAVRIANHVRAYAPAPAARAMLAETRVKILKARIGIGPSTSRLPRHAQGDKGAAGAIAGIDDEAAIVQCGNGTVAIESLIAPNHPRETGAAFAWRVGRT
ncbi:MAG TPA: methionyl-tRNA formyltransferase [Candidatus Tyrphobacter sp.]